MTISNSTFYTDLYTAVRNILLVASLETTLGDNPEVLGSYNDKKVTRPQVIIEPAEISEARYKFGSNEGKKFVNLSISIYASKRKFVNELAQQVEVAMKGTDLDDLALVAMDIDNAFVNPNEAKYHLTTLTFTFDRE